MNAPEKHPDGRERAGALHMPATLEKLAEFDAIIDVRSPAEFDEDHLPGARNFPVLSNEERIRVGTLYMQTSAFVAKKTGASLVARNIAGHIENSFIDQAKSWKPLVYCWRGGARSGAMTHILRSIGWPAVKIEGGYKAWRGQVITQLDVLAGKFTYTIICGRTGSGKSRLLAAMAANGQQVLDLEKLAAHKGSVLGDLPGEPQPSQKRFESGIWMALSGFDPLRPVYVEAESAKVGSLRVPEVLIRRMRASTCHELSLPSPLRVALLREEYLHFVSAPELLFSRLDCLRELHSRERIEEWKSLVIQGRWDEFVADMLARHYDPAYAKSMFRNYVGAEHAARIAVNGISADAYQAVASSLPS